MRSSQSISKLPVRCPKDKINIVYCGHPAFWPSSIIAGPNQRLIIINDPDPESAARCTEDSLGGHELGPLVLVALAIRFEGPGPVLDRLTRIGRRGRRFQLLKFRTTVHDPKGMLPISARQPTQIGEFLRHSRIECLPQLINVLRGEISIVDPDHSSPSFFD